jgi:prepilin-type N-terminal cleavage/methylation domain-containing protein
MNHIQKSSNQGFTFVEIMVAVAVVAIGLVAVLGSFITSYQIFQQTENYNQAVLISLDQFWQLEDALAQGDNSSSLPSGELTDGLKKFQWAFEETPIQDYNDLKEIKLKISWLDGKRTGQINWATYLIK